VNIVVDALACYRLVRLVQRDTITDPLRHKLLTKHGTPKIATLVTCPWCASPYLAAVVLLAHHVTPRIWGIVAKILAFSAVTGVITELVDHLDNPHRE
jgi:hypothetical protein